MTYHRPKNQVFVVQEKGNTAISLAIIFGLVLMTIIYLSQINGVVARNFQLRAAQNSLKKEQEINQQALISLMRVRAMNNLENAAKSLNLVSVEKVSYLNAVPKIFVLSQKP